MCKRCEQFRTERISCEMEGQDANKTPVKHIATKQVPMVERNIH